MKIVFAALAIASCTPTGARTRTPAAQPVTSLPASPAAGIYWVPYATCATCEAPTAIAAYFVDGVAEARAIAQRLEGTLALGLPFVVHASEVGLAGDRIVVAVGAYPQRSDAEAAARAVPVIGTRRAEVVDVAGSEGELERMVVRIDRGAPATAWSRADVDRIEAEADEADEARRSMAARRAWVQGRLQAVKPACTVAPGELFVVEKSTVRWYEYAPVQCGGTPAYVAWTHSLLGHAAIVRDGTGYQLHQVVGAMCDRPIIESWRYDERGRRREPPPAAEGKPTRVAGC